MKIKNANDELTDTLSWLSGQYNMSVPYENDLKPMLSFLILWGLFESQNFDPDAKSDFLIRLVELVKDKSLDDMNNSTDRLFLYFRERYIVARDGRVKFDRLNLGDKVKSILNYKSPFDFVLDGLSNDSVLPNEKTICVFIIIYRFRNNLFHGRKRAVNLNVYKSPFLHINRFLRNYMSLRSSLV